MSPEVIAVLAMALVRLALPVALLFGLGALFAPKGGNVAA
jgi:hypothetical protein